MDGRGVAALACEGEDEDEGVKRLGRLGVPRVSVRSILRSVMLFRVPWTDT